MTEAEHNRPIPKFFGNRPAKVFGETIILGMKIGGKICEFTLADLVSTIRISSCIFIISYIYKNSYVSI